MAVSYNNCNAINPLQLSTFLRKIPRPLLVLGANLHFFEDEEMVEGMIMMRKLVAGFECAWELTKPLV